MPDILLSGLHKAYGDVAAVDGVDLEVAEDEFFTHARPVGLGQDDDAAPDRGLRGARRGHASSSAAQDVTGLAALRARRQHGLPGLRAVPAHDGRARTSSTGCASRRSPRDERRSRAPGGARARPPRRATATRKPGQLSGGQRQRVALARAIVNRPRVLLLDEPLGALDLKLRQEMQVELKRIQREVGITFVYVTHDQEEALTMSDRLAVFNAGRIEQVGAPGRGLRAPGDASSSPASSASRTCSSATASASPSARRRSASSPRATADGLQHGDRDASARSPTPGWSRATSSTSTRGGELQVVRQNLDTTSADALAAARPRRSRSDGAPSTRTSSQAPSGGNMHDTDHCDGRLLIAAALSLGVTRVRRRRRRGQRAPAAQRREGRPRRPTCPRPRRSARARARST